MLSQTPADTMERLIPELCSPTDATGMATLQLHVARYEFAAKHGRGTRWLDIACGVGYGTSLLKQHRPDIGEIVGVDISATAIEYACSHYVMEGVRFVCADALTFRDAPFDTIVSLETLEHLDAPGDLLKRFSTELLAPDGILIASVPITPSVDVNPWHKHDFTYRSFRQLLHCHGFLIVAEMVQIQHFNPWRIAMRAEARAKSLRPRLAVYYCAHPRLLFRRILAICRYGFTNRYLTVACRQIRAPR